VAATAERFGGVDILVNNSGGPPLGRFADFTDEDWRKAFDEVTLNAYITGAVYQIDGGSITSNV
jgi:NADP-dependent 3-hydroxy acid dehydrogenase YdfG